MTNIDIVAGGQFGSEAKGTVAARLLDRHGDVTRISVRVGGPNAGHTVYDHEGNRLQLRQVPVGVIFPDCTLAIAAGSEVDYKVLGDELHMLEALDHHVRGRLFVDPSATVLTQDHINLEKQFGMTARLGSTAKGIGAARSARILREATTVAECEQACLWHNIQPVDSLVKDHEYACFEGTQGYGLGLHTDFYPFCTSGDCRAIDILAQVGVNPWDPGIGWIEPWLVFRPYPIRVAGNSGPLRSETTWHELGLPEEHTTVTKKVRRVGRWDPDLALAAVRANGTEVSVAVTMADQASAPEISEVINDLQDMGARVRMVGYGPELAEYYWYPHGVR